MSLQSLWSLSSLDPARAVNLLALFFCIAGGWLLLATRWREQGRLSGLSGGAAGGSIQAVGGEDGQNAALNRFFYCFGALSLTAGLALSLVSQVL